MKEGINKRLGSFARRVFKPVITQSDKQKSSDFMKEVYRVCLGRQPTPEELQHFLAHLSSDFNAMEFFIATAASPEAAQRQAHFSPVRSTIPFGHFYSPIVDPDELRATNFKNRQDVDTLEGIDFNYSDMTVLITTALSGWTKRFPQEATPEDRYYANNEMYSVGDATVMSAFLQHFKPTNWIEVGSGFSSAVLLDTLDRRLDLNTAVTFIEPHTERLDRLLRHRDRERFSIIRAYVQDIPLSVFDRLGAGDVLFLDTTHVSKTGSDVNHELFQILPRLAQGVIVHFHDVFDGLEYPDAWIFDENRSWNEQYVLRAFLMYNKSFKILYANDAYARHNPDIIERLCPDIMKNPGGGLWLLKQ